MPFLRGEGRADERERLEEDAKVQHKSRTEYMDEMRRERSHEQRTRDTQAASKGVRKG